MLPDLIFILLSPSPLFIKVPCPPLYCTTLPFPFVIKTLLKTQPTVLHLHQHTESTCKENREREKKKVKEK